MKGSVNEKKVVNFDYTKSHGICRLTGVSSQKGACLVLFCGQIVFA
jgi:hypothetical protein